MRPASEQTRTMGAQDGSLMTTMVITFRQDRQNSISPYTREGKQLIVVATTSCRVAMDVSNVAPSGKKTMAHKHCRDRRYTEVDADENEARDCDKWRRLRRTAHSSLGPSSR